MRIAMLVPAVGFLAACSTPAMADDEVPNGAMLRYPDVSASEIVFVYANDLWLVSRDGGLARPLASPPGTEQHPKFDPSGRRIAFVGNYDGDVDLYTIPSVGGVPTRITHHPTNESLCDWIGEDEVLMSAWGMNVQPAYDRSPSRGRHRRSPGSAAGSLRRGGRDQRRRALAGVYTTQSRLRDLEALPRGRRQRRLAVRSHELRVQADHRLGRHRYAPDVARWKRLLPQRCRQQPPAEHLGLRHRHRGAPASSRRTATST